MNNFYVHTFTFSYVARGQSACYQQKFIAQTDADAWLLAVQHRNSCCGSTPDLIQWDGSERLEKELEGQLRVKA